MVPVRISLNRIARFALACAMVSGALACFANEDGDLSDREALVALYHATGGDSWARKDGWLSDAPLDEWQGVGAPAGRVTSLYLSGNKLTGTLPANLAQLTKLEVLDLGGNSLADPLPDLSDLKRMRTLKLRANQFIEEIPRWIGNFRKLRHLDLSENEFAGSVPQEVGSLTALSYMDLSNNRLSGNLPAEMAGLESLVYLDLRWNSIESPLPDLSELKLLVYFLLGANQLKGEIPIWLANLPALERLDLSHNQLVGSLPSDLENLADLRSLNLQNNQLEGVLPPEIGDLRYLERLDLSNNHLTGSVPEELGSLSSLRHLNLSNNNLSGNLPGTLAELKRFFYLDLRWNRFTDPLPDLSEVGTIEALLLTDNEFGGEIPKWIGNLRNLERLDISHNQFRGEFPVELGTLSKLRSLAAHHNKLEGPIPPQIGKLHELRRLILNDNQLTGLIPEELGSLPSLRHLNLSNNSFSGNVPEWVSTSGVLEWIDLQGNSLDSGLEMFRVDMPDYYKFWTLPRPDQLEGNDDREFGGVESMQPLVMDMWAQTSEIIENSEIRAFVFQSLSMIEIHEGFPRVIGVQLPEFIRMSNLRGVVSNVNSHLRDRNSKVESPTDFEKALKAMEGGTPGRKTVDLLDTGKPLERVRIVRETYSTSGWKLSGVFALKDDWKPNTLPIGSIGDYEGL